MFSVEAIRCGTANSLVLQIDIAVNYSIVFCGVRTPKQLLDMQWMVLLVQIGKQQDFAWHSLGSSDH